MMQTPDINSRLEGLINPLLDSINLKLWGVEFVGSILRVYIEKKVSLLTPSFEDEAELDSSKLMLASIDDCTEASRLIGLTLDVEDVIESAYVLEVSTPGLERRFFTPEQLLEYKGRLIEVLLNRPIATHAKRKKFVGHLVDVINSEDGWNFTVNMTDKMLQEDALAVIDWNFVKKSRLLYEEPEAVVSKKAHPGPKKEKNK